MKEGEETSICHYCYKNISTFEFDSNKKKKKEQNEMS